MSKFHKNCIITGNLDSFCLLCESYLRSEKDANNHIQELSHKKNLESCNYLERFKDDNIRKVKSGYYCEYCNLLFSTMAKTNIHVDDTLHIENKNKLTLTWAGMSVIASNDIVITSKAWNGFIEDTCAVCNIEITDDENHKNEPVHILNLIKKSVEFGTDGFMYRMVDENSYHCLTCNMIFAMVTLSSHHANEKHKIYFNNCYSFNLPSFSKDIEENSKVDTKAHETNKDKIFEHLIEFQKKGVNINFETENAFCTKCSLNVDMTFEAIESHVVNHQGKSSFDAVKLDINNSKTVLCGSVDINHNRIVINANESAPNTLEKEKIVVAHTKALETDKKEKPNELKETKDTADTASFPEKEKEETDIKLKAQDKSQTIDDPQAFAEANHLTYNYGNNNAYCRICNVRVPSSLKCMKEHTAGALHNKNKRVQETKDKVPESKKGEKDPETKKVYVPKKTMKKFMKSNIGVQGLFYHDVVVNDKYCLTWYSFLMITRIGANLRCQVCEVNLEHSEVEEHSESPNHEVAMEETLIVTNLPAEFVREVRPGLYHCGFCNLIAGDYQDLNLHFMSHEHKAARNRAALRLADHLPDIRMHRMRERDAMFRLFGHLGINRFDDW